MKKPLVASERLFHLSTDAGAPVEVNKVVDGSCYALADARRERLAAAGWSRIVRT